MNKNYDYKNCQSLFGYAEEVHKRSKGVCQLCDYGRDVNGKIKFDIWRQLTVEHLIGKKQEGYKQQIKAAIDKRFPDLSNEEKINIVCRIDKANTTTACSFCNSTTSRYKHEESLAAIIEETEGNPNDVVKKIKKELKKILLKKRNDVKWKLKSIHSAYRERVKS